MTAPAVAAVDLGASGGRVMAGEVSHSRVVLHEVHRFPNTPVTVNGTVHWDVLRLYAETLAGLRAAARNFELASAGVDAWGVDYGLLDASGALLGNPVHYRDSRTDGVMERVLAQAGAAKLYELTGVQQLSINTIYQLVAAAGTPQLAAAATLLLIPDLLSYWLTGQIGAELTNASTTGLYDPAAGGWATGLMAQVGIPPGLFPPLRAPGERIGELLPEAAGAVGQRAPLTVIAAGSHDTASAVAAVPADGTAFAYISCGTWSLVGVELDQPVLTEASRLANFTNEAGIDGTVRYLRNVMGLWLLQESVRAWSGAGRPASLGGLLTAAARAKPLRSVVDPHDPAFLPPGDMPGRIAAACHRTGQPEPTSRAETVRCILDSLALAHRRAVHQAQQLSGHAVDAVHIVGGGSRNELLCQLTADACQLPVLAGPAEAAALGNILVQARTLGAGPADLPGMRALVRGTQPLRRYEPAGAASPWLAAAARAGLAGG
ncbi:MAG TPA: rhamnulokinase family protein [Streptosporangiaceae bacterium]|jgi:rhamnulokinase